jgi:hypothetical protein
VEAIDPALDLRVTDVTEGEADRTILAAIEGKK